MSSPTQSSATAIVLAAGKGQRLGGAKALLLWPDGEGGEVPLAIAHARRFLELGVGRVQVVLRPGQVGLLLPFAGPGIELVGSNRDEALGAAGSLQVAAERLAEGESAWVAPVDTVPPTRGTWDELARGPKGRSGLRPRALGKGGHPVWLSEPIVGLYRRGEARPLRDVLRERMDEVVSVDVSDPSVLININTRDDVMAVLKRRPRFLE